MNYKILNKEIEYDGTQLRSHFIYDEADVLGDAIVAFIGPANVKITEMVDLVDVKNNDSIKSKSMIHFIFEFFSTPLKEMILNQRLFISICTDLLRSKKLSNIFRSGDDIFINDKKLSVSIATASAVSSLIHVGINIDPRGAPVKAAGLKGFKIDPKVFAKNAIESFIKEYESINNALCKVRPVK